MLDFICAHPTAAGVSIIALLIAFLAAFGAVVSLVIIVIRIEEELQLTVTALLRQRATDIAVKSHEYDLELYP